MPPAATSAICFCTIRKRKKNECETKRLSPSRFWVLLLLVLGPTHTNTDMRAHITTPFQRGFSPSSRRHARLNTHLEQEEKEEDLKRAHTQVFKTHLQDSKLEATPSAA